ncbi:hypothetical protein SPRG_18492, partial [Saprolegnia parasitica CBS 223.65]
YFCSFLFWLAVGCWYVALLSFSPAVGAVSREEIATFANVFSSELLTLGPKALMYCVFLIATSAGLLVSFLAGWHFYLVLTAQLALHCDTYSVFGPIAPAAPTTAQSHMSRDGSQRAGTRRSSARSVGLDAYPSTPACLF